MRRYIYCCEFDVGGYAKTAATTTIWTATIAGSSALAFFICAHVFGQGNDVSAAVAGTVDPLDALAHKNEHVCICFVDAK